METAESLLQQKLVYAWQSLILLLPNIVVGLVVLAAFWLGAWFVERTVKRVFHPRQQHDLGDLLGGFSRWGTIGLGLLVAATIIFPVGQAGRCPCDARHRLGGDRLRLQGHPAELVRRAADPSAPAVPARRPDRGRLLRGHCRAYPGPRDLDQDLRRTPRGHPEQRSLHAGGDRQHGLPDGCGRATMSASATATTSRRRAASSSRRSTGSRGSRRSRRLR